ncbi:MAG: DUF2799 domain-containing protein [Bdellovibrionales bacterium]|nr:DUF2799 domain-containing protein [Bdellovibrionales bacterium]
MKAKAILFPLVLAFLMTSCASALKKQCEKTNWFEYGKGVALKGKRLNSDNFIPSCEKEEVPVDHGQVDLGFKAGLTQYCSEEGAYQTGRKGQRFTADFCGEKLKTLKARYQKGLTDFCSQDGYKAGSEGYVYESICPKNLEKGFLKEYRKGRIVLLEGKIDSNESEINRLQSEIHSWEADMRQKSHEIVRLSHSNRQLRTTRRYDPDTKTYVEETTSGESDDVKRKIEDLERDQNYTRSRIDSHRRKIGELQNTNRSLKAEIRTLRYAPAT